MATTQAGHLVVFLGFPSPGSLGREPNPSLGAKEEVSQGLLAAVVATPLI